MPEVLAASGLDPLAAASGLSFAGPEVTSPAVDPHSRELFWNHIWESLNAAAKILFFAVLTPMMFAVWGQEQFGLFAVANSCVALMVFLDFGLRTLTRVGLTNPRLGKPARLHLHALHVAAFTIAASLGLTIVILLAISGLWERWLHLPPGGDFVVAASATIAAVTMILQLLTERIAAAGKLSSIKAALFAGNLLAFVLVLSCLRSGVSLSATTVGYFGALAFPMLFLLPKAGLQARPFLAEMASLRLSEIASAFRLGGWINVITASWLLQSYGLIFLISFAVSPAEAGIFFLYLKLSEFLSVLGASASEPTIAALAGSAAPEQQRARLHTGYRSAVALCLTGAVGYTFFCTDLFQLWLGVSLQNSHTGMLIGLLGMMTAFGRMITAASLGLANPRPAALGALGGAALMLVSVVALYHRGGAEMILAIGAGAGLFFIPAGVIVSTRLRSSFAAIWVKPIVAFIPSFCLIALLCWVAARFGNIQFKALAAIAAGLISVLHIFRHSPLDAADASPAKTSHLGYDTRSLRSALVMRGVDLLRPFHQAQPFVWKGPCVVSSLAGLGDLFIHLPLIAGVVKECERRGLRVQVALRPAHVDIGAACGWDVLPFDNALEDFFKNPRAIRPTEIIRRIRATRQKPVGLWIDLTGNAIGALAIKTSGAEKLAARITRGGRSFIDHPLPHTVQENEYGNTESLASYLGCSLDYSVFARLRVQPLRDLSDAVVLAPTTVCRWRNWPLANFLELATRFPETHFAVTGFSNEVLPEEAAILQELICRPNVSSLLDTLAVPELIRLIAHARAVVTNDTSTAHIANGFRKPGAVLFGPALPETFAFAAGSLKVFVDRSCPIQPCVQWHCSNQPNWCMRKIEVDDVSRHLASLLEPARPTQAAAFSRTIDGIPAIGAMSCAH